MQSWLSIAEKLNLDPELGCQFLPASAFVPTTPHAEGADRAWSELHNIAVYQAIVVPFPAVATRPLLIFGLDHANRSAVISTLQHRYPADHAVQTDATSTTLAESLHTHSAWLYLPALPIEADLRALETLEWVMARLAGPFGCPWDREQTHDSLRPFLLEETHETLEALDAHNWHDLSEELGDVLLQVVFHAELGRQASNFNLGDVCQAINTKLLRRHPHIFADIAVNDSAEVLKNWEVIKANERAEKGKFDRTSVLDGIPKTMPLLSAAQLISKKAAKVGFDWDDISGVWAKIHEEIAELRTADAHERESELGDLLFAVTNLARWLDVDAESALRSTITKFRRRFTWMEQHLASEGRALEQLSLAEADVVWNAAKDAVS